MKIIILIAILIGIPLILTLLWKWFDLSDKWIMYLVTTLFVIYHPNIMISWENYIDNTPERVVCYNYLFADIIFLPISLIILLGFNKLLLKKNPSD